MRSIIRNVEAVSSSLFKNMAKSEGDLLTLERLKSAAKIVEESKHCRDTPLLCHVAQVFGVDDSVDLYMKLESMQVTGSFKMRGVVSQFASLQGGCDKALITMSAGNYGRAIAYMAKQRQVKATVIMPETAPANRATIIQSYGVQVEKVPKSQIQTTVNKYVAKGNMIYLHPFDDLTLIAGYGSIVFEVLSVVAQPDVVLIPCGGGGVLAGMATALKLSLGSHNCRVYGVQPHGARSMYESFKSGHAVGMAANSVAAGLSPPYAGAITYQHCRQFVDDILLVSDEEIVSAMFRLYDGGLVVEPSGAAAFAALMHDKVPHVKGQKVIVLITGGNATPEEFQQLSSNYVSHS